MPTNTFSFTTAAGAGTQEAQRSSFPPPPLAQTGIAKVLVGLTELGVVGVKLEDIPKLLPPDQTEPALVIMVDELGLISRLRISIFILCCSPRCSLLLGLTTQSVEYKRFVDNVPLAIDYELVHGGERGSLSTLDNSWV